MTGVGMLTGSILPHGRVSVSRYDDAEVRSEFEWRQVEVVGSTSPG